MNIQQKFNERLRALKKRNTDTRIRLNAETIDALSRIESTMAGFRDLEFTLTKGQRDHLIAQMDRVETLNDALDKLLDK